MAGRKTEFSIPNAETSRGKSVKMGQSASAASFFGVFYDEEEKPNFNDSGNRKRFMIIVFAIITLQLVFTVGCTIPFVIMEEAKTIVFEKTWLIFVFLVILIVPYFMLVCCESTRREFPTNVILLLFLTIGMAGTCACCSAWFETVVVLYTFLLTLIVVIFIMILACVCPFDFTSWRWIIGTMLTFLTIFVVAAVVISFTTAYQFKTFVYPGILIALFSAFLLHDIKAIMGGHRYIHIEPNHYILGAAQVYVDVVGIFITFLEIVGTITEND